MKFFIKKVGPFSVSLRSLTLFLLFDGYVNILKLEAFVFPMIAP